MDRRWDDPPPGVTSGGGYHSAPYGNHAAHQSRFDGGRGGGGGGGAYHRDFQSPGPSRNQGGGFQHNNHNNRQRNTPQHQHQQQQQHSRYAGPQQHNHGPHNSRRGGGGGGAAGGFAQHNSRSNRGGFGRGGYRNRSDGSGGRRSDSYESGGPHNGAGPNSHYQHNNNRFQRDRFGGSQSDLHRPATAASSHRGGGADHGGHHQRHPHQQQQQQQQQLPPPSSSSAHHDTDDNMPSPPPAPRLSDNFADDDLSLLGDGAGAGSGSGNSFNKRIVFHDEDDPFTADDDLIHSILNENAAEHFEATGLSDITPSNPLVDLTVADELLQTICSSMDMALTDEAVVGGVLAEVAAASSAAATPLTGAADPFLSATAAEPTTPGLKCARSSSGRSGQQAVGGGDQQVTKKLINQLTRMDKHDLKQMINNPDSKYATALQTQARRKNREETRKQLRIISSKDAANSSSTPDVEPDECIDSSAIPPDIFEQIGRALNVDLSMAFPADGGDGGDSARAESEFLMKRLAEAESEWTSGGAAAAAGGAADGFQVLSEVQSTSDCDDSGSAAEQQQRVAAGESMKSPPVKRTKANHTTTPQSASKATKVNPFRVEKEAFVKSSSKTKANSVENASEQSTSTSHDDSTKESSNSSTSTARTPQFVVNPAALAKKSHAILLTVEAPPAKPQSAKPSQSVKALQMWKIPNCYKDFILSKKMARRFVQSAVQANEADQLRILSFIPKLMLYKLVLGEYKNVPAQTVEQFRGTAQKSGRTCDQMHWQRRSLHYAQVFARRLQKQGLTVPGMEKYIQKADDPEKKKKSKSERKKKKPKDTKKGSKRAAREAAQQTAADNASTSAETPTLAEREGVSSQEDLNGFSTDQETPLNRKRTTSITSTHSTTVTPKHIRFDGAVSSADQPETPGAEQSPAAEAQDLPAETATNDTAEPSSVETTCAPTAKHIRFDAPPETETVESLPETSDDPETLSTTASADAVVIPPESVGVVSTEATPSEPIEPEQRTEATSSTPDADVASPAIEMPLPIVAAKPAAEFVECDDGRLAQRLCTSSAELRQTLKHVPKHIRTAISKRLRELNEGELQAAARTRRSTSAALELEEDVIDVTPEMPSVDLTALDDAEESGPKGGSEKGGASGAPSTSGNLSRDQNDRVEAAADNSEAALAGESTVVPLLDPPAVSEVEMTTSTTTEGATREQLTPNVPHDSIVTTEATIAAKPTTPTPIPVAQPTVVCPPPPVPQATAKTSTSSADKNPPATNAKSKTKTTTSKTDTKKPSTKRSPEPRSSSSTRAATPSKSTKKPATKPSTKSRTGRDSSRESSTSRDRPKPTPAEPKLPPPPPAAPPTPAASGSGDQRLWRSPGEKKCGSTPIAAAAVVTTSKASVSTKSSRLQPAVSSTTTTTATAKREATAKANASSSSAAAAANANEAVLQRMKDIDRDLLDSQQKKMQIDQQIMGLQEEKSAIEAAQMGWHDERSRLLASLMSGCSSGKPNPPPSTSANSNSSRSASSKKRNDKSTPPPTPTASVAVKKRESDEKPAKPAKPAKSKTATDSKRKRKLDASKESDDDESPIKFKRRNAKRPIDLTESDIEEDSKRTPVQPAQQPAECTQRPRSEDHGRLLPDEQQMNSILHNQCRVRLQRLTVENIAAIDAPTFTVPTAASSVRAAVRHSTGKPTEANADDTVSSLSDDSGSLDEQFDGYFTGHRLVIVYVQICGKYLLAASEDGNVYKYVWRTGRLAATFAHHTQTVTALADAGGGMIMSISLDGFVRQFHMKKFDKQLEAHNVDEPLQATAFSWNTVFVGSKSGKIYVLTRNEELNRFRLATEPLCTEPKAVMSLVPSREGPRNILIVGSRSSDVTVRDAQSGLLLRTIRTPDKTTVYSLLLNDGVLYCGTNHNQMLAFDFANGQQVYSKTLALGTICIRTFGARVLLCGCYDGNIYAIDKRTGEDICQISGSGKMLLNFVLVKNKIIAATKNSRSMQVCKLPDAVLQYGDGGAQTDQNPDV